MLYQCTVTPAPNNMAINTKGPGVSAGSAAATATAWSRIDLEFDITQPSRGQTVPTISGRKITFKAKEGATLARASAPGRPGSAATVTCAGGMPAGGEGVTDVSVSDSAVTRGVPRGPAPQFTCTVTGTVERPQFTIGMWTRPIVTSSAGRQGRAEWSWGLGNGGSSRKSGSIIWIDRDYGDRVSPSSRVPCASETPALRGIWSFLPTG